jgi:hypothetical protein
LFGGARLVIKIRSQKETIARSVGVTTSKPRLGSRSVTGFITSIIFLMRSGNPDKTARRIPF